MRLGYATGELLIALTLVSCKGRGWSPHHNPQTDEPTFSVQKPCAAPSIRQLLVSHYPVPLSLSPDGHTILLKTINQRNDMFGIRVMDRRDRRKSFALDWPEPMLRIDWRPDGSEIAFFSMRANQQGRDLYIWKLGSTAPRKIATPLTIAQSLVKWSPDGHKLAFSDPVQGVVTVDTTDGKNVSIFPHDVATFDWSPDSSMIAFVRTSDLEKVELVDPANGASHSHRLSKHLKIFDLAYSPKRKVLLLVTRDISMEWSIQEINTTTWKRHEILRSHDQLGSPVWLPNDRGFCFKKSEHGKDEIYAADRSLGRLHRLNSLSGFNDIRGVMLDSSAIVVAHRDADPVALYFLPISGATPSLIYAAHSDTLPSVKATLSSGALSNGFNVPLSIWRSPFRTAQPRAIIRVHGGHAAEIPVWQEPIQLSMQYGIDFVTVNYRGESLGFGTGPHQDVSNAEKIADIIAAIEYVHENLGTAYSQIILLGHSSGANLAASVALSAPTKIGLLVLVSFDRALASPPSTPLSTFPKTVVFYPEYDTVPLAVIEKNLLAAFGKSSYDPDHLKLYKIRDDHNLMDPGSWASVYSSFLEPTCEAPLNLSVRTNALRKTGSVD